MHWPTRHGMAVVKPVSPAETPLHYTVEILSGTSTGHIFYRARGVAFENPVVPVSPAETRPSLRYTVEVSSGTSTGHIFYSARGLRKSRLTSCQIVRGAFARRSPSR